MIERFVHGQPIVLGLFAGHDDVDVVPASQTVVGYRQKTVRVRGKVDTDDLRLLVDYMVDEAGVLM